MAYGIYLWLFVLLSTQVVTLVMSQQQCYSCLEHNDKGGFDLSDYLSETNEAYLKGLGFNHLTSISGCRDNPDALSDTYRCPASGRQCQIWDFDNPTTGFTMTMRGCDILNICKDFNGTTTKEDPSHPGTFTTATCCENKDDKDICNANGSDMLQFSSAMIVSILAVIIFY